MSQRIPHAAPAIKHTKKSKKRYKVTNWKEYNAALVKRGSLDVWIDADVIAGWYARGAGKVGAPRKYSDVCIQTCLTLQALFSKKLRNTEGFVRSILHLLRVERDTPDHTTIARRSESCAVSIRVREMPDHVELYADSTGGKVSGEGEWKVRKHGAGKRRQWIKIHLGLTPEGDILSVVVTRNDVHDSECIEELLDIEETIDSFGGDGAYDTRAVYNELKAHGIHDIRIPPQKNAKIWQHGNCMSPPHPRDENLRAVRRSTRAAWKRACGYHTRSNAETAMFRYKTAFSDRVSTRCFARQNTEVRIKVRALNMMTALGMPTSIPATL